MKAIFIPRVFFLLIISCLFISCDKEKLAEAIANRGPCYCPNPNFTFYNVNLKRVNTYPTGSKILIESFSHPKGDSSTIYNHVVFDGSLPAKDTTLIRIETPNHTKYLKWKISAANNDSLFGGITPKQTATENTTIFEINY